MQAYCRAFVGAVQIIGALQCQKRDLAVSQPHLLQVFCVKLAQQGADIPVAGLGLEAIRIHTGRCLQIDDIYGGAATVEIIDAPGLLRTWMSHVLLVVQRSSPAAVSKSQEFACPDNLHL